eukprot:TRINITY_DN4226_c0_g1_i10.p1 TRINITY_DN4226_c0_g1~~TRINITY_DN4226_c0_g1_i10.p1  ORF type:complete len:625 (+),score=96.04 TRINITY_DN4226_c0_g1_i10:393-2267(+)
MKPPFFKQTIPGKRVLVTAKGEILAVLYAWGQPDEMDVPDVNAPTLVPRGQEEDDSSNGAKSYIAKINPKHCDIWRWEWMIKQTSPDPSDYLDVTGILSINIRKLEHLVKHGKTVPFRRIVLKHLARAPQSKEFSQLGFMDVTIPLVSEVPPKQNTRLTIQLFKYQLDAIAWAREVEESSQDGWKFKEPTPVTKTCLFADTDKGRFFLPQEAENRMCIFKTKGGMYCDEVGLGKTLTMLGLLLDNPAAKHVEQPKMRNRLLFPSRATLVLCPNHLAKQWVLEAEKHISPKLKVFVITTILQARKVTYKDLMTADLVVVSFQLLKNPNYLKMFKDTKDATSGRCNEAITRLMEIHRKRHPTAVKFPIVEHMHWHRLILDEGHEVLTSSFLPALLCIDSTYRWYVTGTPVPNGSESVEGALRFLNTIVSTYNDDDELVPTSIENLLPNLTPQARRHNKVDSNAFLNTPAGAQLLEAVHSSIFWRNTKNSVAAEYHVPDVVEEVITLTQSDVERGMYQEAALRGDQLRMRQICCHPQISEYYRHVLGPEPKTLEQIRTSLIEHAEGTLASNRVIIASAKARIQALEGVDDKEARRQVEHMIGTVRDLERDSDLTRSTLHTSSRSCQS